MAGGVNEVHLVVVPVKADGCRAYGDAAFSFLGEVVHGGGSFIDVYMAQRVLPGEGRAPA